MRNVHACLVILVTACAPAESELPGYDGRLVSDAASTPPDAGVQSAIPPDGGDDNPASPDGDADVGPSPAIACVPRTCESIMYSCGTPDDGCGSPLYCGDCRDGIECHLGECICPPDPHEPGFSVETPRIGTLIDDENTVILTHGMISANTDIDTYEFVVEDTGIGGNPRLTIKVTQGTAGAIITSVIYTCQAGGTSSVIAYDASTGTVETECNGSEEDGVLQVSIAKRTESTEECVPYEFQVTVSE